MEIGFCWIHRTQRSYITSNVMRDRVDDSVPKINFINVLRESDNNASRANIIVACIKATEFARQMQYKEALKELTKELKRSEEIIDIQKSAISILKILLSQYEDFKTKSLLEFHALLLGVFPVRMSGFRAGLAKTFYQNNSFHTVTLSVTITENNSFHRTIHKAKGAEFNNVLLVLNKKRYK